MITSPMIILIAPLWSSGKELPGFRIPVASISHYYPDPGSKETRTCMVLRDGGPVVVNAPVDRIDRAIMAAWSTADNVVYVKVHTEYKKEKP